MDDSRLNKPAPHLFVLGAGRPHRGEMPSALVHTSIDKVVLDWIIEAFRSLGEPSVHFMGGYGVDQVAEEFSDVDIIFNPEWSRSGSGDSLLRAPLDSSACNYICYGDTVVSADAVTLLESASGEVVIAVDSAWRSRYDERAESDQRIAEKVRIDAGSAIEIGRHVLVTDADAEFTGLIKISDSAVNVLAAIRSELQNDVEVIDVPSVLSKLIECGLDIRTVDIGGRWAELNEGTDLARFVLRSKAESLEALRSQVRLSVIDPAVSVRVSDWQQDPAAVASKIFASFPSALLAVRSSAAGEDSWASSQAGKYHTELNVLGGDIAALTTAMGNVATSYWDPRPSDQILIQEMVVDVTTHGVVITRTMSTGGPYYTINYDDNSNDTTTVTSGTSGELKTVVVYRGAVDSLRNLQKKLQEVISAVQELERLVGHDSLDVEFAISGDGVVHILQVRPLTTVPFHEMEEWDREVETEIASISEKMVSLSKPAPFLFGNRSILGIMPDWNPAEIIGKRPRSLALSLYRRLVTDDVWSIQRREYGYRDVAPHPLLHELSGHPYVDTRAMFNSFVPNEVSDGLADRLVNCYLDRLQEEPQLHDKVEFDIALTCLTFDFDHKTKWLQNRGVSESGIKELRGALHRITGSAITRRDSDSVLLEKLKKRYSEVQASEASPVDKAFFHLEDCKRFGTLPFAHMARTAFIAVALLRSLESIGVTTPEQTARFMEAAPTVASQLDQDALSVKNGNLDWDDFVNRYGHLRPGTYDVTVRKYADDPERYLRPLVDLAVDKRSEHAATDYWDAGTRTAIAKSIGDLGFDWSVEAFEEFVRGSIQDREYAKFVFSKSLSSALENLVLFADQEGLTKDDLSYLDLKDIESVRNGEVVGRRNWLRGRVDEGRRSQASSLRIELPPLIFSHSEVQMFESWEQAPNFVTVKRVRARVIDLGDSIIPSDQLEGAIVLIPNADPGFDWLLARPIVGLITMYGGTNSHMSIRAAEMSLPAAVGVGERRYASLAQATEIELDCESRRIEIVR
jgi:glutamine kinase